MSEMIDRIAKAIEDAELDYSIRLTSLIDGVSTYTLRYSDGVGPLEFNSHSDALEHCRGRIQQARARAAIEAMPTADLIEEWLRTAPFEKVKAVHDLCHAAMSDRFRQGVKPPQRTLKRARAAIDAKK